VDDAGDPQGEGLVETTQRQNSNLQRLIDAVGTLLAGSHEVLKRLQPMDRARGQTEAGIPKAAAPPPPGSEKS
jgi:hypothetical protein